MRETAETLQTLVLLMTLLLQVIMTLSFVYILRFLVQAVKELATSMAPLSAKQKPVVEETLKSCAAPTIVLPTPPTLPRYKCARCDVRLPEQPVTSKIIGDLTLLIYKCGRCGKHTEVDPTTGEKKEVEAPVS
jgi:DNA-directed RNA polymerase subunit RPC12/RpoP